MRNLPFGKKGSISMNSGMNYVWIIIAVVVLFQILVVALPLLTTAGTNLSTGQGGLFTLFGASGILLTVVAAGVIYKVFKAFTAGK